MAMHAALPLLLHQALQRGDQAIMALLVVRLVGEDDRAVAIERHPVVRIRQILRGQPKVQRVLGHHVEREPRSNRGSARLERYAVELAHERDVSHRMGPILRPEVEIVHRESLLKDRRVRALGERHENRVDVPHVVSPNNIGTVRQSLWMSAAL